MAEVNILKSYFQFLAAKMNLLRGRSKSEDISAKAGRRGSFCKVSFKIRPPFGLFLFILVSSIFTYLPT